MVFENMKICDVLPRETILADLKAQNKKAILEELVAPVAEIANVNPEDLVKVLMERERLGSTGIGGGINCEGSSPEISKSSLSSLTFSILCTKGSVHPFRNFNSFMS